MARGRRSARKAARTEWASGSPRCAADKRGEFERRMRGDLPARSTPRSRTVKRTSPPKPKEIATRMACECALESLIPAVPEMIGGSADLTGSNNTRTKAMKPVDAPPTTPAATSTTACASTAWPPR